MRPRIAPPRAISEIPVAETPANDAPPKRAGGTYRAWAELLKRAFDVDVLHCPKCNGRRKLVAMVTNPVCIARYLAKLGELADVPPRAPSRGPPYWKSTVLRRKALGDVALRDTRRVARPERERVFVFAKTALEPAETSAGETPVARGGRRAGSGWRSSGLAGYEGRTSQTTVAAGELLPTMVGADVSWAAPRKGGSPMTVRTLGTNSLGFVFDSDSIYCGKPALRSRSWNVEELGEGRER